MQPVKLIILIAALNMGLMASCNTGNNHLLIMNQPDTSLTDRKPAVAGQFYPGNKNELSGELETMFSSTASAPVFQQTAAIISPHAGYVFSGEVAAAAFHQLDASKALGTIFIIGCSHRSSFAGGSIYTSGNYITPLGTVPVDLDLARKLSLENKVLSFDPQYQLNEHSIEVQVPFLQYHLKQPFRIVPILLGTQNPSVCRQIAKVLKPYMEAGNLFVISTDFSHYPAYNDAVKVDKALADAILTNKPETFLDAEEACLGKSVSNLATGCCSWPAVLTLMYMTAGDSSFAYHKIMYRNSGDSKYGEKDRVVGYNAMSVTRRQEGNTTFSLSRQEQEKLLSIARNTIETFLLTQKEPDYAPADLPLALKSNAGAFVTLRKKGELRGCIGHFEADKPLYRIVQQMAVAAATQDYRFPTVTIEELKSLDMEISVLTPMRKIKSVSEIQLGIDGIYIRKGSRAGTFLPQVATETKWTLEEFLGHCARDKAGIGWEGWKDKEAEIFVYQAFVFEE